jgi:glycosyltransferase involved in cell wall biosynthesis
MRTRGGEERIVVELARRLADRGITPAFACDRSGPLLAELDGAVEVFPVDYYGGELAALRATRAAIASFRPDVVHCHGTRPGISGRAAGLLSGVRTLWTVQLHPLWGPRLERSFVARNAFRLGIFLLSPFTSATVFVSSALERSFRRFAWPGPMPRAVVHNAIDTDHFRPDPERAARLRFEHAIPADAVLAGMVARLTPRKGIDLFLGALASCGRDDLFGVVAGEGDDRARLEGLIEELGLGDRCLLLGEVEDCGAVCSALDVGVLPSQGEGLPRARPHRIRCRSYATSRQLSVVGATKPEATAGPRRQTARA